MTSKQFARCIAKISGDGNLYYTYIRYSNTCKELLDEFEKDIKHEFKGIKITKGVCNSRTSFLQIHGRERINKFLEYLPDYKSHAIFIPKQIIKNTKEIKKEYLRAFYDDEGSPSLRIFKKTMEWKRNLTLSSNSKIFLSEVKEILKNDFNIKTNKIRRTYNNSERDKSYYLGISGKSEFIKFNKEISFLHPKRKEKLNLIIASYGNTYHRNREGFNKIKEKLDKIQDK